MCDARPHSGSHLENCGVSEQLDLKELRDVADNITHFVVECDYHLLFVGGALGSLRL